VINERLQRGKEERGYPVNNTAKEANWIGHILRRNCLLKHIIEGKTEGARIQGRRRTHLRDNLRGKKEIQEEKRSTKCYKTNYMIKKLMQKINNPKTVDSIQLERIYWYIWRRNGTQK